MKKFEYLMEHKDALKINIRDHLNDRGQEGWELISIKDDISIRPTPKAFYRLVFKREMKSVTGTL